MLAQVVTPGGWTYRPSLRGRILALLRFMGPRGADPAMLIEYGYGDDAGGGPLEPRNVIAVTVNALVKEGWPIARPAGRTGPFVMVGPCPPLPPIAIHPRPLRPQQPDASPQPSRCPARGSRTACSGPGANGAGTAGSC